MDDANSTTAMKSEFCARQARCACTLLLLGLAACDGPDKSAVEAASSSDGGSLELQLQSLTDQGAEHVDIGTEVAYADNPPASGPHYPVWTSFEIFDAPVPREYWVHSLEHGGVALLYGPAATPQQRESLTRLYDELPADPACGHARALLTADPELEVAIAVVAWRHVLSGSVVDREAIMAFVEEYRGHGPEDLCSDGAYGP